MNSLTPTQENYGFCKRFDLVLCLFRRRLDLWKSLLQTTGRSVSRCPTYDYSWGLPLDKPLQLC